jgi:hypothetical protein
MEIRKTHIDTLVQLLLSFRLLDFFNSTVDVLITQKNKHLQQNGTNVRT